MFQAFVVSALLGLAALEDFDRREASDVIFFAEFPVLIGIDLGKQDRRVELACLGRCSCPLRRERLAVAAPRRVELHKSADQACQLKKSLDVLSFHYSFQP